MPQSRIHALSRRLRDADRATASDRTKRSCRGTLLVAMEGTLDQRRPVRADYPAHRRRAALHRFRGHLLACGITSGAVENAESPAEAGCPHAIGSATRPGARACGG